ncbi:hypothetical protein K443DRAFT_678939 [Laccaria amethystina LaAM-08-1]|uniref:Uncharacterized protein n=1 Tax=Laccaria amethystina LaAM-08-1 TaxID=1095629 RepID=A0A0C9XGL2_9AGAR|nr:hypothetical protein K443DRAFT_678939 [Laccaria amethystina LaAM-08-1]
MSVCNPVRPFSPSASAAIPQPLDLDIHDNAGKFQVHISTTHSKVLLKLYTSQCSHVVYGRSSYPPPTRTEH